MAQDEHAGLVRSLSLLDITMIGIAAMIGGSIFNLVGPAMHEGGPSLLIVFLASGNDVPYPEPLHAVRPIVSMFGMALVLAPHRSERALAALHVAVADNVSAATCMAEPELERLRLGNPAARGLPLLAAIARGNADTVRLDEIDVAVTPS